MIYDSLWLSKKGIYFQKHSVDKGKTENTNARIKSNGVPFDKQHIKK